MELTYTWKLTSLKKATNTSISNAIIRTEWDYTGTDVDGDTGTFHGVSDFDITQINAESFVPFEELTEEIVLDWVKQFVDGLVGFYQHMDEHIYKQINDKKLVIDSVSDTDFPWNIVE
jgi:hypothetical protein